MQANNPRILESELIGAEIQPGALASLIKKAIGDGSIYYLLEIDEPKETMLVLSSGFTPETVDLCRAYHPYGAVMKFLVLTNKEVRRRGAQPAAHAQGWEIRRLSLGQRPAVIARALWVPLPQESETRAQA